MNLVEVWIGDIVKTEEVVVDGVKMLKISFNTDCWGSKGIETRMFNSMEDWKRFKEKRFYLG